MTVHTRAGGFIHPRHSLNTEVTTMLVLKRNINEEIIITINGVEAVVTITEISPTAVKLGITAPRSVTVDRREVWEKKQVLTKVSSNTGE